MSIEKLMIKADLLTKSLDEAISWNRGCFPQARSYVMNAGLAVETAQVELNEVNNEDGTFAGDVIECNLELARINLRLAKAHFDLVMNRVVSEHVRGN